MLLDHDENKVQPVMVKVQRQFKPMKARHNGRAIVLLINPTTDDQAIYEKHAPRASSMISGWQGIYKDDAEMGSTSVLVGLYEDDPATKRKGVN